MEVTKTKVPMALIRRGVTPEINAIGTMVLMASLLILIAAQLILRRRAR